MSHAICASSGPALAARRLPLRWMRLNSAGALGRTADMSSLQTSGRNSNEQSTSLDGECIFMDAEPKADTVSASALLSASRAAAAPRKALRFE